MQVPVKVTIDSDTKEFEISIGTPPASSLIKKEAGIQKGSGNPLADKVADLKIEQIIKIAKMKEDALLGKDTKMRVREIIGSCQSMGVLVEGVPAPEALKMVEEGKFDAEITSGKTELSVEEMKELEEEKKKLAAGLEKKRAEYEKAAQAILATMEGKEANKKRAKLAEAEIPQTIIDELVPPEKKEKK